VAKVPSVALFVDRARAGRPDFGLTDDNARAVVEVCVRLDGLPLAIELVAGRADLSEPAAILEDLRGSVLALASDGPADLPERQRSLGAAIGWSYELLDETAQRALRRLAVFAGGWTVEAAAAVAIVEPEPVLAALVRKNLVWIDRSAEPLRYRMLQTIREFALQRLAASHELADARRCHLTYVLEMATSVQPGLSGHIGPSERAWLARLDREQDDVRVALRWAIDDGDAERALELGWALWTHWWLRGRFAEGREWLTQILALRDGGDDRARGRVLYALGHLCLRQNDTAAATDSFEASLAIERAHGDASGAARAFHGLGLAAMRRGDLPTARGLLGDAVAIFQRLDDGPWQALVLNNLGQVASALGELDVARAHLEESLVIRRAVQDAWGVTQVLADLGAVAEAQGDIAMARSCYTESIRGSERLGDPQGVALALEGFACLAAATGDEARLVRLAGTAAALRDVSGTAASPARRNALKSCLSRACDQLGPEAYERLWTAGRDATSADAVALALAVVSVADATVVGSTKTLAAVPLTRREREVVVLVARGLTNRAIAADLVISEATAAVHVKHVLQKLACGSRAQVAAWAALHGLIEAAATDDRSSRRSKNTQFG
jgi:non-specific serine/threonine protein kinase